MMVGKKYDITIVPCVLRGWSIVEETNNHYVIKKTSYFKCANGKPHHHNAKIPKSRIMNIKETEGELI